MDAIPRIQGPSQCPQGHMSATAAQTTLHSAQVLSASKYTKLAEIDNLNRLTLILAIHKDSVERQTWRFRMMHTGSLLSSCFAFIAFPIEPPGLGHT
jgi:hypothetical protein